MDAIRAELEMIAKRNNGVLLAESVVEAAKDKNSPMHDQFDWDDSEAAHKWRLTQAEGLIRKFRIVIREARIDKRKYRSAPSIPQYTPSVQETGYRRTEELLSGPDKNDVLLAEWNRCNGHVCRLVSYLEHAGMSATASKLKTVMAVVYSDLTSDSYDESAA